MKYNKILELPKLKLDNLIVLIDALKKNETNKKQFKLSVAIKVNLGQHKIC